MRRSLPRCDMPCKWSLAALFRITFQVHACKILIKSDGSLTSLCIPSPEERAAADSRSASPEARLHFQVGLVPRGAESKGWSCYCKCQTLHVNHLVRHSSTCFLYIHTWILNIWKSIPFLQNRSMSSNSSGLWRKRRRNRPKKRLKLMVELELGSTSGWGTLCISYWTYVWMRFHVVDVMGFMVQYLHPNLLLPSRKRVHTFWNSCSNPDFTD